MNECWRLRELSEPQQYDWVCRVFSCFLMCFHSFLIWFFTFITRFFSFCYNVQVYAFLQLHWNVGWCFCFFPPFLPIVRYLLQYPPIYWSVLNFDRTLPGSSGGLWNRWISDYLYIIHPFVRNNFISELNSVSVNCGTMHHLFIAWCFTSVLDLETTDSSSCFLSRDEDLQDNQPNCKS